MICQECQERPAVIHFTNTVNGQTKEVYLCEQCANEQDAYLFGGHPAFSIQNLIGGLFGGGDPFTANAPSVQKEAQCPSCGLPFQQFLKTGKFGCADCYAAFDDKLKPILKRLHGGNTVHHGKIPARMGGALHLQKKLQSLREDMQKLVAGEQFEQAAAVRDEIRALEGKLSSEGGGSDVS